MRTFFFCQPVLKNSTVKHACYEEVSEWVISWEVFLSSMWVRTRNIEKGYADCGAVIDP